MVSISGLVEEIRKLSPGYTFDEKYNDNCGAFDIMLDPVRAADGQIYDRGFIEAWFNREDTVDRHDNILHKGNLENPNPMSPLTGKNLDNKILMPAYEIQEEMVLYLQGILSSLRKSYEQNPATSLAEKLELPKEIEAPAEKQELSESHLLQVKFSEEYDQPQQFDLPQELGSPDSRVPTKELLEYNTAFNGLIAKLAAYNMHSQLIELQAQQSNVIDFIIESGFLDPEQIEGLKNNIELTKALIENEVLDGPFRIGLFRDLDQML